MFKTLFQIAGGEMPLQPHSDYETYEQEIVVARKCINYIKQREEALPLEELRRFISDKLPSGNMQEERLVLVYGIVDLLDLKTLGERYRLQDVTVLIHELGTQCREA